MSWIRTLAELQRELREFTGLVASPAHKRPFVVYAEDASSYAMFEGYLDVLRRRYRRAIDYVSSDPNDPLFDAPPDGLRLHFVRRLVPNLMGRLDSPLLLVTMPDLAALGLPRPPPSCHCLYAFHSLNSVHEVYQEGAFDAYDGFLCAGPHHKRELERHFGVYGLEMPELHETGYPRLDRVAADFDALSPQSSERPTVLVAPSWGRGNLLEVAGVEVVEQLLAQGARVIVRPHPCFFLPIYPEGRGVVDRLLARFGSQENWTLESSVRSADSFLRADLMVSDFSGAATEYALGTCRPVLFLDVARKTRNPNWRRLGLPCFEDAIRHEVGAVLAPDRFDRVGRAADELLAAGSDYRDRITALRREVVYNFGRSAEAGAEVIEHLLERAPGSSAQRAIA